MANKPAGRAALLARSIDDYLADVAARNRVPKTLNYYEAVLTQDFLKFCQSAGVRDLGGVDQRLIDRWTTNLGQRAPRAAPNATVRKKHLSKATVHSYERTVNHFLKWAHREGEITHEVKAQLPRLPDNDPAVLLASDVELMERAARDERDKLIIAVLWQTGIRASELTNLTTKDLIEGPDRSYFLRIVLGKGGKTREVPIPPALYRRLRRFIEGRSEEEREQTGLWLSVRRDTDGEYQPLEPSGLGQMLHTIAHRAGVKKQVNPHAWRHSYATEMVRKGMPLPILMRILGHTTMAMLAKYAHPTADDMTKAMMKALKAED